jgi:hypothetical protein
MARRESPLIARRFSTNAECASLERRSSLTTAVNGISFATVANKENNMQKQRALLIGVLFLAAFGTEAMAAGSFVGQWTCSGAATPASGAFQTVIAISANGTWQMQESIAPAQNLVGAMVRGRGTYQQTGADSLTLNFLEQQGSSDGVNWVAAPAPAPWTAKLEGNGLNVGGTLCHRSG